MTDIIDVEFIITTTNYRCIIVLKQNNDFKILMSDIIGS